MGVAAEKIVGEEEGFKGREAVGGVGAVGLAAGVGGEKRAGEAAGLQLPGELFFHNLGEAPGAVDEEEAPVAVCSGEGRGAHFEEEGVREVGKGVCGVGEKEKVGVVF